MSEILDNVPNTTDPVQQFELNLDTTSRIIVIGSGPAGIRFAHELLKRKPTAKVSVFGNEPYEPYNRVQLSALLAGDVNYDDILTTLPNTQAYPGFSLHICSIRKIDPQHKVVIDINGDSHAYDKLVIATGARPHKPNIPGYDQTGVYTFRSLKDTEALFSRISRARKVVVVGGGLLGLEAARALLRHNTEVTVIQQGLRLMNRQLDDRAATLLQAKVEALGIKVITQSGVRQILGDGRVTGVMTRDKQRVECDTVLVCAGIKPNMEIARASKIHVNNGILVNDQLQTSAEDVYAIGECCEHLGQTYGLVNPGYEQAAVCADILCGGHAKYVGSLTVSRLKVVGESVCSMGEVADVYLRPRLRELTYSNKSKGIYRKLVIHKGHIIGALSYGEWPQLQRVQEAYQARRYLMPWQALLFLLTGNPYTAESGNQHVKNWPLSTVICQCNNITLESLVNAIDIGHNTSARLQKSTGAGTVCGSCKPLLNQLTESTEKQKEKAWLAGLIIGIMALAATLFVALTPGLTPSDSVQTVGWFEKIWSDKFYKQVTGFTLLGMSSIGLLMSLRKKFAKKKWGDFAYWRLFHIALGGLCATTLIAHTGLHLGENFNQLLMLNFLLILGLGALATTVISLSHTLPTSLGLKLRKFWSWSHILITWPLPILLAVHILTVYYF